MSVLRLRVKRRERSQKQQAGHCQRETQGLHWRDALAEKYSHGIQGITCTHSWRM
jgi:hypothetical protein